jgi:hypothetical protein
MDMSRASFESHKISRSSLGRRWRPVAACVAAVLCLMSGPTARAYVEIAYTLGRIIQESSSISLVRVEKVDKEKNLILYRKVKDLKGTLSTEVLKHNIGRGGFHPREWQNIMTWAEPGKTAVFFNNGGASETCLGDYWYQAYAGGEWWNMSHAEPFMLRSFAGNPEKLASIITAMLAGQEVVVPCMVDGDKNALHLRTAKIQRLRASMKLQDYNAKRDFVGWGGDDFRSIAGMPGFSQFAAVTRVDPEAQGISIADFDGDGKPDFCLCGDGKVALMQLNGTSINEVSLPYTGGARSADWADYNGDGKPDLLLATPSGPKLLTNLGGTFRDDSASLPPEVFYNVTAAAWLDYDGDKRPDILLATGFLGLRVYRNLGEAVAVAPTAPPPAPNAKPGEKTSPAQQWFADISTQVGLGPDGLGGMAKGDSIVVADVNEDGRSDFLYSAGDGMLVLNTPQGFVAAPASGLRYQSGKVTPVFGDYNGDKHLDLFVPQNGGSKMFTGDGQGHFVDVTANSGALAQVGQASCGVWSDFDKDGRLDLVVGCLKGPNRYFRNDGQGWFVDAGDELGLYQRIFNSRGVGVADLNQDGAPDLLLNNEGQESVVLLGNPARQPVVQVSQQP